jgi:signal transduction histidine kinase
LAPAAQVIIVTGYTEVDGAIFAMRLGAADYILKPINPDELRTRLGHIAQRRKSEEQLRHAQQRALQAERLAAIGQVFTGLAHESRNALQRSQACLEMLARRVKDRPEALELIGRIQNAQNHLHRLYEEVRGYAAPLRVQYERVDLGDLLQQVWDHLEVARKERRTHLRQERPDLDLNCEVDRHGLEQIFRNLLENSLAACADPVLIEAHWSETHLEGQPSLRLALRDNGPGLTAEARQRIFEPFYTTKTQGTGLGMAIVQRIVEAHRGRIAVGADLKPGAEIVLDLPREAT